MSTTAEFWMVSSFGLLVIQRPPRGADSPRILATRYQLRGTHNFTSTACNAGAITIDGSSESPVEKKINGCDPAVTGNDEISPGDSWRLTRAPLYPPDRPAVAQFAGRGTCLISKGTGTRAD